MKCKIGNATCWSANHLKNKIHRILLNQTNLFKKCCCYILLSKHFTNCQDSVLHCVASWCRGLITDLDKSIIT